MELRENGKRDALDILFAALAATLATLLLVLVFALIVRWTAPGDSALLAGNCAIRVIAVAAGVLIAFRRPAGGAAKGLIAGVLYYLVTLLVLSARLFQRGRSHLFGGGRRGRGSARRQPQRQAQARLNSAHPFNLL